MVLGLVCGCREQIHVQLSVEGVHGGSGDNDTSLTGRTLGRYLLQEGQ